MNRIGEIHDDLKLISIWYSNLQSIQKDLFGSQILWLLPSLHKLNTDDSYQNMIPLIDETIKWNDFIKSYLLLSCLFVCIEHLFEDYPKTIDEFLDWMNQRKNIRDIMYKDKIKEQLLKENEGFTDLSGAHYNSMKQALEGWEIAKASFKVVGRNE